jgi:hypothetical protein
MELQGSLVLLISYRMVEGREEKKMQFVALWHLFKHGRLMTNFEEFKQLFQFLKVDKCL